MARITRLWPPSYRRSSSGLLLFLNRKNLSGDCLGDGDGDGDLNHIDDPHDPFCFSHMRSYAAATWATMEAVHNLMLEVMMVELVKIMRHH